MKLKELMNMYGEYEVPQELVDKFELLKKPKSKTIWNLAYNDLYNWIDGEGNIGTHHWCEDEVDLNLRKAGNVFLTYKEAAGEKERREVEALLLKYGGRRWLKNNMNNWYIAINYDSHATYLNFTLQDQLPGTIYFDSREELIEALFKIGEKRVENALFEVR